MVNWQNRRQCYPMQHWTLFFLRFAASSCCWNRVHYYGLAIRVFLTTAMHHIAPTTRPYETYGLGTGDDSFNGLHHWLAGSKNMKISWDIAVASQTTMRSPCFASRWALATTLALLIHSGTFRSWSSPKEHHMERGRVKKMPIRQAISALSHAGFAIELQLGWCMYLGMYVWLCMCVCVFVYLLVIVCTYVHVPHIYHIYVCFVTIFFLCTNSFFFLANRAQPEPSQAVSFWDVPGGRQWFTGIMWVKQ